MQTDRTPTERRAAEIIQTWLDGAPPDAAAAVAANPDFAAEKAIVLDLAFAEFLIREHKGERVDAEEFCARFPDHHASLGRMLAQQSVGDRALGIDGALPDALADRTVNTPVTPVRGAVPSPAPRTGSTQAPSGSGSGSSFSKKGSSNWPTPGERVGDFNLLRQLGKGAFGRVFLAVEEPTTRHVVVKLSRQRCDEAKVLGRLGHRNVVSVLSAPHDMASGLFLVVMPYHGSATLEDLLELAFPLRKGGDRPRRAEVIVTAARRNLHPGDPVPGDQQPDPFLMRAGFIDGVVWLGVRMADALAAVHQCGFVHHDLKPSNVLLGLDGQPRVLDFNLASDARNAKSRLGGTLPYMPPEHLQAVRQPETATSMDARGDVYSLGVILYELLTGTHPFGRFPRSRSVRTVAEEMLTRQKLGVRPLRERNPDVSHRLARLVEKCLAFEPNDRPQSAIEVANELRQCYSVQKRALQFMASRPGRLAATAAAIGLVSAATWLASAQARPGGPVNYRQVGMTALADGRYADAMPMLTQAALLSPDDADVWLALGRSKLAQREWLSARGDLEKAAQLRPVHGPTQCTLAWCLAKLGHHQEAQAALAKAESNGYTPVGLYALRAYTHVSRREDREAAIAIAHALALDANNRQALVNRAQLGLAQSMGRMQMPTEQTIVDVERALSAGPTDGYLCLWASHFYAWLAHKPAAAQGKWFTDAEKAKSRSLTLLKLAVENGISDGEWNQDSTYRFLFGDPANFARDWRRPAQSADPSNYWRSGDPLVAFQ